MTRKIFISLIIASMVLILAALPLMTACEEEVVPQEEEILKIGCIFPLTGSAAVFGQSGIHGVQLAVDEINREGIEVNGVIYKFEVISRDDEYFADKAVDAARKLIERDQVDVIFGPMSSAGVIATAPIAAENEQLQLASGANLDIHAATNTYTFNQGMISAFRVPGYVQFLAEVEPDVHTVCGIYTNDATGQANVEAIDPLAQDVGWDFKTEGYDRGTTDFSPLCAKVAATEPDLVFILGPTDGPPICKGLRDLGYTGPFAIMGVYPLAILYEQLGDDIGTAYEYNGLGEKPYANDDYVDLYSTVVDRYGVSAWTGLESYYYTYVKIYAQAIEEAQSIDSTVLRDLLATPDEEWYNVVGGVCYMINDELAEEMGLGNHLYFNCVSQCAKWDNALKKAVNTGWYYPYGWIGGELPE